VGTENQNALLPHLERALGSFSGEGFAEPEWNIPFSAFRWPNSPETGINTLVSFGLGRHLFQGRRQEILLALRPTWDEVAVHIIVSVGMYVLDRHLPLNVGETVGIPPQLETATRTLVVASSEELAEGLGVCFEYEPPVEILWLMPTGANGRFVLGPGSESS
jgi:hypothetical protein